LKSYSICSKIKRYYQSRSSANRKTFVRISDDDSIETFLFVDNNNNEYITNTSKSNSRRRK